MKTAAVNQNSYSVYQTFKTYKEPDQRNKYAQHCDSRLWFLTNTHIDVSSQWDAQFPYGDLIHKATCTLEFVWQLALASGLKVLSIILNAKVNGCRKYLGISSSCIPFKSCIRLSRVLE